MRDVLSSVNVEKGMRFYGNRRNRGSVIDAALLKTEEFHLPLGVFLLVNTT